MKKTKRIMAGIESNDRNIHTHTHKTKHINQKTNKKKQWNG